MSLRTNVFEDGRWITRSFDPYHVRAQNTRRREEKIAAFSTAPAEAPSVGIITRTLARSSIIKQIIPARIRGKSHNDVIFIGSHGVVVKEAFGNYTLEEVVSLDIFDAPILVGRIIGDQREIDPGDKYATVRKYSHWNEKLFGCAPFEFDDEQRHDPSLEHKRLLPPHILVLVLASNKLVFVCADRRGSNPVQFIYGQHDLPCSRSPVDKLGEFMAVDPKSRAMAVASLGGRVYLYRLKSMEVLSEEVEEGSNLNPLKEERLLSLEGTIMKMEFLHPSQSDQDEIVLLLTVHKDGRTRMIWFEWDSNQTLRESPLKSKTQILGQHEQVPLLLIPLTKSTAFLLICEKRITLYRNILTGSPTDFTQHLEVVKDPEEPGNSTRPPIWTQWARPMRPPRRRSPADCIYLCREDGVIQFLEFHHDAEEAIDSSHQVGRLGIHADTAFAILDVGPNTIDLLIAGGCGSEGGLWCMEPRMDPMLKSIISDWAPLSYFCKSSDRKKSEVRRLPDTAMKGQEQIYACTGTGKRGAISEVRYGLEASMIEYLDLHDRLDNDMVAVWAFCVSSDDPGRQSDFVGRLNDIIYILVAHPTHTTILALYWKQDEEYRDELEPLVNLDITERISLDYSVKTIFAAVTAQGSIVQVTPSAIVLSAIPSSEAVRIKEEPADIDSMEDDTMNIREEKSRYCFQLPNASSRFLAAYMHVFSGEALLLTAVESEGHFYVQLGCLNDEFNSLGESWPMQSQPCCLYMHLIANSLIAFVATLNRELHVFHIDGSGISPAVPTSFRFETLSAICDSMALISTTQDQNTGSSLFCGLRNGSIQTLHLDLSDPNCTLFPGEEIIVGNTSVTIRHDATSSSGVIAHCEQTLIALELALNSKFNNEKDTGVLLKPTWKKPNIANAPATVHRIWINDWKQSGFNQGTLSAITQIGESLPFGSTEGLTFGSFVGVHRGRIQLFKLASQSRPQLIPRRLHIGGTPDKVLHSTHLKKLIILYNRRVIVREKRNHKPFAPPGERITHSLIRFLDPDEKVKAETYSDSEDTKPEDVPSGNDEMLLRVRKPTETFLGITEWFPQIGGSEFYILIVNTKYEKKGKDVGRLLLFTVVKGEAQDLRLVLKRSIETAAPAYSVAIYPNGKSILYCSGGDLCLQSIEDGQSDLKLHAPITATIRAPARSITVREPYIYVSTGGESLAVFKYEEDKLVYQYGDRSIRNGIHHTHIPEHSLIMTSDMTGTISGLWQPPERRIDNAMTKIFEAILPGSITHFERVRRPPWYRNALDGMGTVDGTGCHSFIGSSVDGTITQFDIIDKGWRLLRFLQNMAERNTTICPLKSIKPYKRHIEPSTSKPHHRHINGDLLQRVLENGAEGLIKHMLNAEPDLESQTDFDSVESRWERWRELAGEVVDVEDTEWMSRVVQWVRYRLQSAL